MQGQEQKNVGRKDVKEGRKEERKLPLVLNLLYRKQGPGTNAALVPGVEFICLGSGAALYRK